MSAALGLTEALIACRSVTPADGGAHALLAARLTAAGFACEHFDAGPAPVHADTRVHNLYARHGDARPGPTLLLLGHTDVVPPGPLDAWASDPFVPTHRAGRLYGRGAADMKSAVAAMTVAAEQFIAAHPEHPGRVALLFTSDEEGPSLHGVRHVVEVLRARSERLDACVVGEPTSVERLGDTVKNGRRGSLSGRLVVNGVQGHVAYPQLARNPVHEAAAALAELAATRWDEGNEHFPPTTFQISNLHAGTGATNVIPGTLAVDFNFRFGTESTPALLRRRVEDLLARHRVEHRLDWTLGGEPFLTPPGRLSAALAAAIRAECGVEPQWSTTGGTSDGRFVAQICPEVMEFGVLNASIHKVDEWVDVAAIEPLTRIYRGVLERLLGAQPAQA
ncbi:MAG: succinyl-diaminopimelate desuccinylase [Burkholderiales bacterium]|nr:succinyl-diaminopimelate desuccinylase [Burkholderiales bacterium]